MAKTSRRDDSETGFSRTGRDTLNLRKLGPVKLLRAVEINTAPLLRREQ